MTDTIDYTRTFQHQDWRDNVDRVQADGPNGFNNRFHALEGEFDKLHDVIHQVSAAIETLNSLISRNIVLSFAPGFLPEGTQTTWSITDRGATAGPFPTNPPTSPPQTVNGWLPLLLPDNTSIQNITVFGRKQGKMAAFQIQFQQQVLQGSPSTTSNILQLESLVDGPFAAQFPLPKSITVNNTTSTYMFVATWSPATPNDPTAQAQVSGFQIVCTR